MKFLIAGLGNPGEEYKNTRHNIGRDIVELFCNTYNFPDWHFSKKGNALITKQDINNTEVILILPETFMNNSGTSLAYVQKHYEVPTENIIIVHDDIDMALGQIRIAHNRGTGGHNGLKDINKKLQTKSLTRLRFGIVPIYNGHIKKPRGEKAVIDFVLKKFKNYEEETISEKKQKAVRALYDIIINGREHAMNNFNEKFEAKENEEN